MCLILESELNGANKMKAINTLAICVATYRFDVIKWKLNDKRLDAKTRETLTQITRMHYLKSC